MNVKALLDHVQATAEDVIEQNKASCQRIIQLDTETKALSKKLAIQPIEPDERIAIAQRLVELQTERKTIVTQTMKRNEVIEREFY